MSVPYTRACFTDNVYMKNNTSIHVLTVELSLLNDFMRLAVGCMNTFIRASTYSCDNVKGKIRQ